MRIVALCALVLALVVALQPTPARADDPPPIPPATDRELTEEERSELARAGELSKKVEALYAQGNYQEALPLAREALEIREKVLGPDHSEVATSLHWAGRLMTILAHYSDAQQCLERALAISEQAFGADSREAAESLDELGILLHKLGDYPGARPYLERTLAIKEKVLSPEHPDTATSLNNLGVLLRAMGDLPGARPYHERTLAIREKVLGPEHPDTARSLSNLGTLLYAMGQYAGARPYFERTLAICEKVLGPEHPDTATSLNNLGALLRTMGELAGARPYFERAQSIFENVLGPWHPATAGSLHNQAALLFRLGDVAGALPLFERALAIREKVLGLEHPDTAQTQKNLGGLYWHMGEMDEARRRVLAGFEATEKTMQALFDVTSERERILMVESLRGGLDVFISLFNRPDDAGGVHSAALRWKGVVAESLVAQWTAVLSSREPELSELFDKLTETRRQLATAVFATPTTVEERERRDARLSELTVEKERRERELAKKSKAFRLEQGIVAAGSAELCARLPDGTALVDYLRYTQSRPPEGTGDFLRTPSYVAFVLFGGACESPIRVELGAAAAIEEAVLHYRQLIDATAAPARVDATAKRLGKLVWDPVAAQFGDRTRVWVIPDAALAGVPFGALVDEDGKYLIEQYHLGFLSSGQQLLRLALEEQRRASGALVAGGIDYNAGGSGTPTAEVSAAATRAAPTDRSGLFPFGLLAATGPEAEAIAKELGEGSLALLTGVEATEPRIKHDAPGRRVLHLATHGFFATGKVRSALEGDHHAPQAGFGALEMMGRRQVIGFNPMVLSGVILAGANARAAGEVTRGDDDGVLTAEEVASLDLRGAELVVLSACETGLGEVKSGEGVLGLRRAFAFAGARALVMSLWKVPDQETMELMQAFYARVKAEPGLDKGEAMRAAQLELIQHLRQRDGVADPRLWAAWVVSGR